MGGDSLPAARSEGAGRKGIPIRVIGLLNWYDEPPDWLAGVVGSLARVCDHLIAIDGAYFLYPDAKPRSTPGQYRAIQEVAYGAGMGCTLHSPQGLWLGNEVEKRTFMFRMAELVSEPDDWYFLADADHILLEAPGDFRARLEATDKDAVEVTLRDLQDRSPNAMNLAKQFDWESFHSYPLRNVFRACRGLHCSGNHFTYVDGEGRHLWGMSTHQVEAEHMPDVVMLHREVERPASRRKAKTTYYARRNSVGAETGICSLCQSPTNNIMPAGFVHLEGQSFEGASAYVCAKCVPRQEQQNDSVCHPHGIDWRTLRPAQIVGKA